LLRNARKGKHDLRLDLLPSGDRLGFKSVCWGVTLKTFLATIGGIAAVIFFIIIGFAIYAGIQLGPITKAGQKYAEETIRAVTTEWDGSALIERATPELKKELTEGKLETIMGTGSRSVGGLVSLDELTCSANVSVTTGEGKITRAECTGEGIHARGSSEYRVVVIARDDIWKVNGFFFTAHPKEDAPVEI